MVGLLVVRKLKAPSPKEKKMADYRPSDCLRFPQNRLWYNALTIQGWQVVVVKNAFCCPNV